MMKTKTKLKLKNISKTATKTKTKNKSKRKSHCVKALKFNSNVWKRSWGFGSEFCVPDALCDAKQPKHTGLHLFSSIMTVEGITAFCIGSQFPHILTNISKQHIFNYLSEINILNKL